MQRPAALAQCVLGKGPCACPNLADGNKPSPTPATLASDRGGSGTAPVPAPPPIPCSLLLNFFFLTLFRSFFSFFLTQSVFFLVLKTFGKLINGHVDEKVTTRDYFVHYKLAELIEGLT